MGTINFNAARTLDTEPELTSSAIKPEINQDEAKRFLSRLCADSEVTTFQIFPDRGKDLRAPKPKIIQTTEANLWSKLCKLNQDGAGIFVMVNGGDGKGRSADNVTKIRAVFADLDGAPLEPVIDAGLFPHILVESSPGRFHAYWLVSDCPLDQFTPLQKAIATRFDSDNAINDLPRVMRIPGFLHQKGESFQSRILEISDTAPYSVAEITEGLTLAPFLDTPTEKELNRAKESAKNTGHRPGDDYNRSVSWSDVLTPAGWTLKSIRNDGTELWLKPGKIGQQSATANHAGSDLLFCFSDSAGLTVREGLSKFATFAQLYHDGDYAAAARELRQQGYGDPIPGTEIKPAATGVTFDLLSWGAERFSGTPEPTKELVKGRIRLGVPTMLAAMGDTGKGFLLLDLALKVATGAAGNLFCEALGGSVDAFGTAVILSAEDDDHTFHERIPNLDPEGRRFGFPGRLITFPFPNAGGVKPFAVMDRHGIPSKTDAYKRLCDELIKLPDLRLIAFDPIQAFFCFDLNKPELAQFAGSMCCELSAETGATTIPVHHMRKDGDIDSPTKAREAIRGSSALVDSLRGAYALWGMPEKEARKVMKIVEKPFRYNSVVNGAVVKANGAADRSVTTYVRNDFGLLVDHTHLLRNRTCGNDEQIGILISAIGIAADQGQPFTKTGANGLHTRRQELPEALQRIGRDRLESLCQSLLDSGKVLACLARGGGNTVKWLDIPEGPFASGGGEFRTGGAGTRS